MAPVTRVITAFQCILVQRTQERWLLKEGDSLIEVTTLAGLTVYVKYQDPIQSSSSDILFTRLFLYKMPVSEKGG